MEHLYHRLHFILHFPHELFTIHADSNTTNHDNEQLRSSFSPKSYNWHWSFFSTIPNVLSGFTELWWSTLPAALPFCLANSSSSSETKCGTRSYPRWFFSSDSSLAWWLLGVINRVLVQITTIVGPSHKINDDERQQSAMGTRKGAPMHSRHSNALQETARFTVHCMGSDYIVAARPHHSCHITSQIMYMYSTIIPTSPQSCRPNVLKY